MRHSIRVVVGVFCLMIGVVALAKEPPNGFDAPAVAGTRGKVETLTYPSKTLGVERPVVVYLPPGYKAETKYPVLYLLHGSGDDETGWQEKGAAVNILDNLYADEKAHVTPMIVAMPYGYGKKKDTPMPKDAQERGQMSRAFDADLVKDLVPFIDGHYATMADAKHRAVAGLSMGGSQSLRIGLGNLDLFSYLGCFSSMAREPFPEGIAKAVGDPAGTNGKLKLFYLATGDKDPNFERIKDFHELLEQKGVRHQWSIKSGKHEWKVWRENLYEFAPLLFHD